MILPQLARSTEVTSLEHFIKDDAWVMEQKLDGNRILLISPGMDMPPTAITRNGSIYTKHLPASVRNFRFPEGEWVLDGELVGGKFWLFDMPVSSATSPATPLFQRRAALETFWSLVPNEFGLVPQAKTVDEKIALAGRALKECYEGLVLKKASSPYRSGGRTEEWLKLKFVKTVDVVVLDVRDDGKESARLGIYRNGRLVDVGRASLIGKEKRGSISPGDVVEVMYLYCNDPDHPRLYQPTIKRRRDDKRSHECDDSQLQYANKTVLQDLGL